MLETMINALALTNEKYYYYLDTDTMTVVKNRSTIGDMDVSYLAHAYPERFLPLPNKRQLHTYAIMEEFAASSHYGDRLQDALLGDRPFQRFRNTAQKLKIWEDWLSYRNGRFLEIALDWCSHNGIDPKNVDSAGAGSGPDDVLASADEDAAETGARDILDAAAALAKQAGSPQLAVGLIEAIRMLFHMLDDSSFETALDQLCAAVRD